ncbi:MAG: TonB-dependent receptor [Acidobacteriota bacterium]
MKKILFAVMLCGLTHPALAQTTTATLHGIVRDESGGIVPGATVRAVHLETQFSRTAITDDAGNYLLRALPVGRYQVITELVGFRRSVQGNVRLVVNENVKLDVVLSIGEVVETVEVSAQMTGVDTRSATMGELVDRERIQELPLDGRNALELSRVIPGVINARVPSLQIDNRGGARITVAGGRDSENEFRLDNVPHINLTHNTPLSFPNPDAVQEFKVLVGNYSAEYGRGIGGVFVVVTKRGSNEFHGSVWEFLRNKSLNARNLFAADKPDLKQNQFGFTAGGPILRDRTFFFASYQGVRIRESQLLASARPPSSLERGGDFSASTRKPIDPLTGDPFPNDRIPASRFDPVAVRVLDEFIPLPNSADGRWISLLPIATDNNQYIWRIDHQISANNSLNFRHFRDASERAFQPGNIAPYSLEQRTFTTNNFSLQDTHTLSPTLLNQLQLGYTRADTTRKSEVERTLEDLGGTLPGVAPAQLPVFNVSGFFNASSGVNYTEHPNIYQLADSLSWSRGRHEFNFGGEFLRTEQLNRATTRLEGQFSFDGSVSENAFADFLLGKPRRMVQASGYDRVVKGYNWYLYFQDNVQLRPGLTANLGLRYEYFQPYRHDRDWLNSFQEGAQSQCVPGAPPGMLFPCDPELSERLVEADGNNFAPRVGLAWDVFGDGKLAVRGGYGLFYQDLRSDVWTYPAVNQPFAIRLDVDNPHSLSDPYGNLESPFPYFFNGENGRFSFPMGLFDLVSPELTTPYAHHLSLSIDRALPAETVLKVGYVGKIGQNQLRMVAKNPATYIPGESTTGNTNSRRIIYPGFYGQMRELTTSAYSTYHSLQVSLNKRFSRGWTVLASYTLGKMIDEYSNTNLGQLPQDPFNEAADRSRSDEDRRHVFVSSFIYQIPGFGDQRGFVDRVLGGWAISGIVDLGSGLPVNIRSGRDFSLTGVGFDRPDLVGDPVLTGNRSRAEQIAQFFNTDAFVANQPGQYGNTGRNPFSGPAYANTDLALTKSFAMPFEDHRLQFRAEFFNVFNQVNFSSPGASLNSRTFGQISSAGKPRILQFALRYSF